MQLKRSSGILLHISSLPGKYGFGGMGLEAFQLVDFLSETGTKYWQILPLNPAGSGNSPYQGLPAFAGNPFFIDPEGLLEMGLLTKDDLPRSKKFPIQKMILKKWRTGKQGCLPGRSTIFFPKINHQSSRILSISKKKTITS